MPHAKAAAQYGTAKSHSSIDARQRASASCAASMSTHPDVHNAFNETLIAELTARCVALDARRMPSARWS